MRAGITGEIDLSAFRKVDNLYYLSLEKQGSNAWKSQRFHLVTASNADSATNPDNRFKTPEQLSQMMINKIQEDENRAMRLGREREPIARKLYELEHQVTVTVPGLMIPVWDLRLGSSLDGLVGTEGMIEIKCPEYMYKNLINYIDNPHDGYHHIWRSHYLQMQMGMAVSGRRWCDYYVLSLDDKRFEQRIPFDAEYWNNFLYPKLCKFFDQYFPKYTCNKPSTTILLK